MDLENSNRANSIEFTKSEFASDTELWVHIAGLLKTLDHLRYVAVVRCKDDVVTVEFNPTPNDEMIATPYWLYPDEIFVVDADDDDWDEFESEIE